jgi:hypothetical protein
MRTIAAILLFSTTVILLLLGGLYLFASKSSEANALMAADDYSLVAGDLADQETLKKEHERAMKETGAAGTKQLILGIITVLLALAQLVCGIQVLRRQSKAPLLTVMAISAAGLIGMMAADGLKTVGLIALGLMALAFIITLLVGSPKQANG